MAGINELRTDRLRKLDLLEKAGFPSFPPRTNRSIELGALLNNFDDHVAQAVELTIAGRVVGLRKHGAALFADVTDGTGKLQLYCKEDVIGERAFQIFNEAVDLGDFIEAKGLTMRTQRGEPSLELRAWSPLGKALLPLPEKFHGLIDEEERYRKRYLDLLQSEDLRALFVKKAKFWDVARAFMKERDFLEVETPTLELTTGGAEARPFTTHHNDYDLKLHLRISVGELWQKRLMAAGFPKTFEIGRVYRNEGSSPEHLQEFTNMEFYWAYASYDEGMKLVEQLYRAIAREVFGTTAFTSKGKSFDLSNEWPRVDYREEVLKQTGLDVLETDEKLLRKKLDELQVAYEGDNRERLTDTLWKHCRKSISGPAFLVHLPKLIAPLAKSVPNQLELTESFKPIIAGTEIGNGYSELNDPLDQRARFLLQQKLLAAGDEEAMMPDWDFVEMLEHGMPPTCGFGFGERLFAVLSGVSLREATLFPLMRPKCGIAP